MKYKELSANIVDFIICRRRLQLRLQLMKAPFISSFLWPISATVMSTDVSQVDVALFPCFEHFLSFLPFQIFLLC